MSRSALAALSALFFALAILAIRRYHWRRPDPWAEAWREVDEAMG